MDYLVLPFCGQEITPICCLIESGYRPQSTSIYRDFVGTSGFVSVLQPIELKIVSSLVQKMKTSITWTCLYQSGLSLRFQVSGYMQIEGRELNISGSSFSFIKFLLLLEKVEESPTRRNPGPLCIATALITVNNQGFDLL